MLTIQGRTEAGSTLNFFWKYLAQLNIAYHDKSEKYIHKFIFLPEFQSHNTLRLLLLHVNYIQLQRKSNNFHGFLD